MLLLANRAVRVDGATGLGAFQQAGALLPTHPPAHHLNRPLPDTKRRSLDRALPLGGERQRHQVRHRGTPVRHHPAQRDIGEWTERLLQFISVID